MLELLLPFALESSATDLPDLLLLDAALLELSDEAELLCGLLSGLSALLLPELLASEASCEDPALLELPLPLLLLLPLTPLLLVDPLRLAASLSLANSSSS